MKFSLLAALATVALAGVVPQDIVPRDIVPQENANSTNIDERSLETRQTGTPPGCGLRGGVKDFHCFCSGAIEFGEIINKGIEGLCDRWDWNNIPRGGHLHAVWCRTGNDINGKCQGGQNTVNYHVRLGENCPFPYYPFPGIICKQQFYKLKDTCVWSFDSHKGGWSEVRLADNCNLKFEIDVNS